MNNLNYRFLVFLLISISMPKAFSQMQADTVKIIKNAKEVTVTRDGRSTTVKVNIKDSLSNVSFYEYKIEVSENVENDKTDEFPDTWGMDIPFISRKKPSSVGSRKKTISRREIGFEHVYWGWRFNYGDKGNVKNGFEVGIRNLIGMSWSRGRHTPAFEIGIGFGMMRMYASDGFVYGKSGDAVTLYPLSPMEESDFSRLDVWRFHVPVLLSVPLGKNGNFSLGGVVNFNTYAKACTRLVRDNKREKTSYKGFQQRLLTADVFASISGCGMGLYFTWSPVALFKKAYGPELKAWSIGVDLFTF